MTTSTTSVRREPGAALVLTLLLTALSPLAGAEGDIRTERVHFAKGATSAVVEGTLRGRETVDYVVGASKGQYMNVSMATRHLATYFNILAPGETEVGFFNGSLSENQYEGVLPTTGDYRIRVYMMRSAARRNEKADYRLEMIITGKPQAAAGHSAVADDGQHYDATGKVPCAQYKGQPMGQCDFGVLRKGNGDATVVITRPDGRKRTIVFVGGRATAADISQADGGAAFSVQREGDLNMIRVGDERYEIPDAVVSGG
jgi:hypothetical protein